MCHSNFTYLWGLAACLMVACTDNMDDPSVLTDEAEAALESDSTQYSHTKLKVTIETPDYFTNESTGTEVTTDEERTIKDLHVMVFSAYGSLQERKDIYPKDGADKLTEEDLASIEFDLLKKTDDRAHVADKYYYKIYAIANVGHLTDDDVIYDTHLNDEKTDAEYNYNNLFNCIYDIDATDEWYPDESRYASYEDFSQYSVYTKDKDSYWGIAAKDVYSNMYTRKMYDYGAFKADCLPMMSDLTQMYLTVDGEWSSSDENDEVSSEVTIQLKFAVVKCIFNVCFNTESSGYKVRMLTDDERYLIPYTNSDDAYKDGSWNGSNYLELYNIYEKFYLMNSTSEGFADLYGYPGLGFLTIPWTLYEGATVNADNYTSSTQCALSLENARVISAITDATKPADIPYQYTARYVCYLPERKGYFTKSTFNSLSDTDRYAVNKKKTTLSLAFKRFDPANNYAAVDDGNGYYITVQIPKVNGYTTKNYWGNDVAYGKGLERNHCYEYIINVKGTKSGVLTTTHYESNTTTRAASDQTGWTIQSTRITEE